MFIILYTLCVHLYIIYSLMSNIAYSGFDIKSTSVQIRSNKSTDVFVILAASRY